MLLGTFVNSKCNRSLLEEDVFVLCVNLGFVPLPVGGIRFDKPLAVRIDEILQLMIRIGWALAHCGF